MAVGFTRPIPSQDEIADEQLEKQRYQSVQAGWTVLCNGRAVLYCDRSEMTGWGETGVPRYHTQFIAISGVVEFKSDDASKLPTTTTKRGIDSSSQLYLQIKNKMREGMRIFVNYTNKWKGQAEESKKHMEAGERLSFEEVKDRAKKLSFSATIRSVPKGEQYRPNLPMPEEPQKQRISFTKEKTDVQCVARYLFEKEDVTPSDVGKKCFDLIHKEARR